MPVRALLKRDKLCLVPLIERQRRGVIVSLGQRPRVFKSHYDRALKARVKWACISPIIFSWALPQVTNDVAPSALMRIFLQYASARISNWHRFRDNLLSCRPKW